MDSKVIRLNKNCLESICKIRKYLPYFADPDFFDISKFSNSDLVEAALCNYAEELEASYDLKEENYEST